MEYSQEIIDKLVHLEIFSDFNSSNEEHRRLLKEVCQLLESQSYNSGDMIIKEGDTGDTLYILYEGTVQIRRNTPSNDQFAVVNLTTEQNVFFGEVALIDRDTRSASVIAIENCKVLKLDGSKFKELCDKEPVLGYNVMYRISRRIASSLRRSNKEMMTLYEALLDEI